MRQRFLRRMAHVNPAGGAVPEAHRLAAWQRRSLYATAAVLVVTGAAWLAVHYARAADALPSPAEPWLMRVHGLAAFVALLLLGALAASHVPRGWRLAERRGWPSQRRTGVILCGLGVALVLTGYLLYYFAPDNIRPALGWVHAGLGAAIVLFALSHRRGTGHDR